MILWAELHKLSGSAMRDVVGHLWPTEPVLNSYFGLVQRLVEAVPCIDAIKRSTCIEGARMAFARVKTIWAKMKATDIAARVPPKGKEHHAPEFYFEDVLAGTHIIEGQCSKNVMFK